MFIELVDALRCPAMHEESWLVLGATRMEGRDVVQGILGCPVCDARYPIDGGIADLRADSGAAVAPVPAPSFAEPEAEQAMRLAAFLGISDSRGFAVLVGEWTAHAAGVYALAETHLLLVNPVAGAPIGAGTSGIITDNRLPIAAASARALAVDRTADAAFLARALAGVQAGGRVVAPADIPVPRGVTELARDAALWVGERDAPPSGLVSLARGAR
ncbi:MAG TPA: hypothetical protein VNF92_00495 [Gemmatimonadaceae bacterium]|nr:hypothetical protein [Gemmatimonadaceae bacterium]